MFSKDGGMNTDRLLWVHVGVMLLAAALLAHDAWAGPAEPAEARRRELVNMVRQDCGSCHGMRLTGGLGPALLPAALQGRPIDSLVATVMQGRPGTAMPGWARFVSEAEARWILDRLLRGFPQFEPNGGER